MPSHGTSEPGLQGGPPAPPAHIGFPLRRPAPACWSIIVPKWHHVSFWWPRGRTPGFCSRPPPSSPGVAAPPAAEQGVKLVAVTRHHRGRPRRPPRPVPPDERILKRDAVLPTGLLHIERPILRAKRRGFLAVRAPPARGGHAGGHGSSRTRGFCRGSTRKGCGTQRAERGVDVRRVPSRIPSVVTPHGRVRVRCAAA